MEKTCSNSHLLSVSAVVDVEAVVVSALSLLLVDDLVLLLLLPAANLVDLLLHLLDLGLEAVQDLAEEPAVGRSWSHLVVLALHHAVVFVVGSGSGGEEAEEGVESGVAEETPVIAHNDSAVVAVASHLLNLVLAVIVEVEPGPGAPQDGREGERKGEAATASASEASKG